MSSKRHSILPAIDRSGPRPPVHFSDSLTISDNAILQGTHSITIQSETVVHPRSKFESNSGSILIGRRCLIHERTHLGTRPVDPDTAQRGGIVLADFVTIEAGSVIEAGNTEIGEGTVVHAGSTIGSGARIGKVDTNPHLRDQELTICRIAPLRKWRRLPLGRYCLTTLSSSRTGQDESIDATLLIRGRLP